MASQGPLSPGTLANDTTGGAAAWTSPSNAAASDGANATALLDPGGDTTTQYLKATNFSFSIPAGATINGILLEVKKDGGSIFDLGVQSVKGGAIAGDDKADFVTDWSTYAGASYASYGGAADLWGRTWAYSDINASTFGAVIDAQLDSAGIQTAYIDHIRITVYYTAAAAGAALSPSIIHRQALTRSTRY